MVICIVLAADLHATKRGDNTMSDDVQSIVNEEARLKCIDYTRGVLETINNKLNEVSDRLPDTEEGIVMQKVIIGSITTHLLSHIFEDFGGDILEASERYTQLLRKTALNILLHRVVGDDKDE